MKRIKSYPDLQLKLQEIMAENDRLREGNNRLKALLGMDTKEMETKISFSTNPEQPSQMATSLIVTNSSSTDEKVSLFRSLFKGRDCNTHPQGWPPSNNSNAMRPYPFPGR